MAGAAKRPTPAAPKVLAYVDMDGSSGVNHAQQVLYDAADSSYQAIVCVGMHARAGTPRFMAHTVTLEPV